MEPEELFPEGCQYLDEPYLSKIAKKLNIDFAPAFFGFEVRGGVSIPIIKGIVVAEEKAPIIEDAARTQKEQRDKKKDKKVEKQRLTKWKSLFKSMLYDSNRDEENTNDETI